VASGDVNGAEFLNEAENANADEALGAGVSPVLANRPEARNPSADGLKSFDGRGTSETWNS
jgi:hypothetical protein